MISPERLQKAFDAFDAYNANDPNTEQAEGKTFPKELLYAKRMTSCLHWFAPHVPEYLQLAARCQHIGRWEIPRNTYPMERKGYLQWRNQLKFHHAAIAEKILLECGYDVNTISIVKFLLLKKELNSNPDTQLLEDVICLVFVEYYLDEFASRHADDKVIDILQKTLKKMTHRAIQAVGKITLSTRVSSLIARAVKAA